MDTAVLPPAKPRRTATVSANAWVTIALGDPTKVQRLAETGVELAIFFVAVAGSHWQPASEETWTWKGLCGRFGS